MTLTQALYENICKDYRFELLILGREGWDDWNTKIEYNAIEDAIHIISHNDYMYRCINPDGYMEIYLEIADFIVEQCDSIDANTEDDLIELLSAIQVEAEHGGNTASLGDLMQHELMQNIKQAFDELKVALKENAYSLKLVEPYAARVDAELMLAGYRPVLTM